jgi:Coenzyme F420-dependent N5,N10-methylene tetrahydromethanopterin reductase and related flavin-dependent oxidoreductases
MNISAAASPLRRLSVLDQAPIPEGITGGEALRNSIDLARLADGLGFHRYWLAEHHATPMLACASPEALIGSAAAATQRLKVGSGGIMLPHYSPSRWRRPSACWRGCFPAGSISAWAAPPASDQRTAYALQRDRRQAQADDFPEQLGELMGYLYDRLPENHPFAPLARTLPGRPNARSSGSWAPRPRAASGPPSWVCPICSPISSAPWGLRSPSATAAISWPARNSPRHRWAWRSRSSAPRPMQEAWRLSASIRMAILLLQAGRLIAVPTPEKALAFLQSELGSADAKARNRRLIAGSPATVRAGIEDVRGNMVPRR